MKQIDTIVNACIERGYVTQEKAPWLCYALEKRITVLLSCIPLFAIGLLLSNPATLFSFYITFYMLRSLTNGWHAKTFLMCLICSIVGEVVFLGILPKLWNPAISGICVSVSIILVWIFAPYNHPKMDLSIEEVIACKRSVKKRLALLIMSVMVLRMVQEVWWVTGIELGVVMTAFSLLLAYVKNAM